MIGRTALKMRKPLAHLRDRLQDAPELVMVLSLAIVVQASCATSSRLPTEFQRLMIENASPDVIRVSIDLGEREILLGRVAPMSRAVLRIRAGTLPPGSSSARIRVVAVGAPSAVAAPNVYSTSALHSDPYRIEDLTQNVWRYSGSRIVSLGQGRQ